MTCIRRFVVFAEGLQQKAMTFSLNKKLSDIYEDNPDFEDYESLDEIPRLVAKFMRFRKLYKV